MTTHVSFIFDDGFERSVRRAADLFQARGLRATFAVLADPRGFLDQFPKGDFGLWNELQSRGHAVHPHGHDHTDLSAVPPEHATEQIDRCLDAFTQKLAGFDPAATTFHLTYNRSTPAVDAHLLRRVRAIRTCGPQGQPTDGLNREPDLRRRSLTCAWHGPDPCDDHLLESLKHAAASDAPQFLYMLHGLDDEGWGPIRESGLQRALDFIQQSDALAYRPLDHLTRGLTP